jgi:hypothetical protein
MNTDYPKLPSILHGKEKPEIFTFSLNKGFLARLLKEADPQVRIKLWNKVEPVEISYRVSAHECYSAIMPMHTPDEVISWHPKEYTPADQKVETK